MDSNCNNNSAGPVGNALQSGVNHDAPAANTTPAPDLTPARKLIPRRVRGRIQDALPGSTITGALHGLENAHAFQRLYDMAVEHSRPKDGFEAFLLLQKVQDIWAQNSIREMLAAGMDLTIEEDWANLANIHEDLDPLSRTWFAWQSLSQKPAFLEAQRLLDRTNRRARKGQL